jgi:hypothetical protein
MKFPVTGIAFCLLLAAGYGARAQNTPRAHAISVNPFGFAHGALSIDYEQRSGTNSFVIRAEFFPERKYWTAFGIGGAYRWYFAPNNGARALSGLAAGPFLDAIFWSWRGEKHYGGGTTSIVFGGELSYKWIWTNFMLEPILSLGFMPVNTDEAYYRGAYWGLGLSLGYAW